jgi:ABC-2 type transport system ATP-binding protein
LLFLDEPTIGLDADSKLAVRRFIKQINREKQVTVILTTQASLTVNSHHPSL